MQKGKAMIFFKRYVRRLVGGLTSLGMAAAGGLTFGTVTLMTATPAAACNSEPYIGTVCTFAFDWCPREYLPADGRTVTVREYQALFALLGFKYGGDNANVFGLPDLRGRSVVGTGKDPILQNPVNLGQKFGQQSVVLNSAQVPLVPHTHPATFQPVGGGMQQVNVAPTPGTLAVTSKLQAVQVQGVAQPQTGSYLGTGGPAGLQAPIYVPAPITTAPVDLGGLEVKLTGTPGTGPIQFNVPVGISGGTVSVGPAGSGAGAEVSTQSPGLGQTVCIAALGLYPNRP